MQNNNNNQLDPKEEVSQYSSDLMATLTHFILILSLQLRFSFKDL